MTETALATIASTRLQLKDKREERRHEENKVIFDTAKAIATNPITTLVVGSVLNQKMYNAGWFNPHDDYHSDKEDWDAGGAVSDWIFFATLTVAACQAAGMAADVIPSLKDLVF